MKNKIYVTKTFLPPIEEYITNIKKAWDKRWLTNNGALALEFEAKLKDYLGVKHVFFVSNGTIAIQLALKALDIRKEVITTPFSFVATTSSILWENCKPVFVDIEPDTFCIDTQKIEAAITKDTEAILAVHVYGYPCNVRAIEKIAKKHNLKVIYDAAHAFGVKIGEKSIFNFGNVSTLSLHATKLFHTGEGGLVITNDDTVAERIIRLRNFGYVEDDILETGINAKNSEFHAALGLTNFKYFNSIIEKRKTIVSLYQELLQELPVQMGKYYKKIDYNFAYFPVIFGSEKILLDVTKKLNEENVFPRRYFYPSLNTLPFVENSSCPVSESIAKRVLCLPLYHDLSLKDVRIIVKIIKDTFTESIPTVSIAIPAFNEENNIKQLLDNLLHQKQNTYKLTEIVINTDGSSDKTPVIVKNYSVKHKQVKLLNNTDRRGKATRLNELYQRNSSDYLLTFDADVLPGRTDTIEKMLGVFENDNKTVVVAGNLLATQPETFIGKIIYTNNLIWNRIRLRFPNGDHIANLYGQATMLTKQFAKSVIYPTNISCVEEYLYIKAKEVEGFRLAVDTKILFKAPESIRDVILQARRSLRERYLLIQYFGTEVLTLHDVPSSYKIMSIIEFMVKSPFYTILALSLNVLIRFIPYDDKLNKQGMWQTATTTKIIRGGVSA